MAMFTPTMTEQLRPVLSVLLLWNTFHRADGICESKSNLYTISRIVFLAVVAAYTAIMFLLLMASNTIEAIARIRSVDASWKRAALSGMLLLTVVGLFRAYFFLAVPVFQEWYRYITTCVGSPSLIAMELTVSMAFLPYYIRVLGGRVQEP